MQKTKPGFTLIEMMLVLAVIATLVVITAYSYNNAQNRARTSENIKRAQDIINMAEQSLALEIYGRKYPDKRSVEWSSFKNSLPDAAQRHISETDLPGTHNFQSLTYITCRNNDGDIAGIKVAYWDYVKHSVEYLKTDGTNGPGLTCN